MPDYAILAERMREALLAVDQVQAEDILDGVAAQQPLDQVEGVLVPAMEGIGDGWEDGSVALSQVYMSARICEQLVRRINVEQEQLRFPQPHMAIAVLEDFHLLGKSIIHSMLHGAGYELQDFGRMDAESLAARVVDEEIQILLVSTLMLRAALRVPELRRRIEALGRNDIRIVVGGAPFRFDPELWTQVGADATAAGASELLPIVKRMTGRPS